MGVVGRSQSNSGAAGVVGIATGIGSSSLDSIGVVAAATATTGSQTGIEAEVNSTDTRAVAGSFANLGSTSGLVIKGSGLGPGTCTNPPCRTDVFTVDGSGNVRIMGNPNPGNLNISGNLQVSGTVSKGGGSFKIDHPLDPANKYLSHSFVESPDMMDIYNGVIVLDSRGQAWVNLPDWFDALNRDFRYQLTAIGAPAPNLYIAREISGNRFKIAGGRPHGKVSWQVTGIRQDPYAQKHRIQVEEEKPAGEQGYYLHPDAYGQPEEKGIAWARNPQPMREIKDGGEKLPGQQK